MERATEFASGLAEVRNEAKDNLSAAQKQQKKRYDMKHAAPTYKVGDKVLKYSRRRDTRKGDKLQPRYTGPFEIMEILGRGVYSLRDKEGPLKQTVNATNLKLWVDRSPPSSPESKPTKRARHSSQSPTPTASTGKSDQPIYVDVDSASPSPEHTPATPWVPQLNLTTADKSIIVEGDWLNDKIIDAANDLAASHLAVATAQTSLLAQAPGEFSSVLPGDKSMQILYDWQHWLTSACVQGEVFVANSAGNNTHISPAVAKQLKQLYANCLSADETVEVNHISCTQQPNASDCGVFATAFLFEWATTSVHTSLDVRFDVSKMRAHLVTCLEGNRVIPFPRLPSTRRAKCAEVMKITI